MVRPMIRMSQIAASVESRGINLMHSLFFLKANSSEEKDNKKRYESSRDANISILNAVSPVPFPSWWQERLAIQVVGLHPTCPPQGAEAVTAERAPVALPCTWDLTPGTPAGKGAQGHAELE